MPAGKSTQGDGGDYHLVCLCTPAQLSVQTIKALRQAFDVVIGVEPLSFAGILRDRAELERQRVDNGATGVGAGVGKELAGSGKSGAVVESRGKEKSEVKPAPLAGSGKRRIRELAHKNLALLGECPPEIPDRHVLAAY